MTSSLARDSSSGRNSGIFSTVKVLLIGDSGVGKTCLILRYMDDQFDSSFISTIGIDFRSKTLLIDDEVVKLQVGQKHLQ